MKLFDPRLRLWVDKNRDGRSSSDEMTSLRQQRITSIDLNYDGSYLERDEHGNEVRMKSVAAVKGGGLLLIFDLWFAYLD